MMCSSIDDIVEPQEEGERFNSILKEVPLFNSERKTNIRPLL
jgi:hypothetical protein